jgi:hypothetical protein
MAALVAAIHELTSTVVFMGRRDKPGDDERKNRWMRT